MQSYADQNLYVEFLEKRFFPFLVSVRNMHFKKETDLEFCFEFMHNAITFSPPEKVDFYLYSLANCQPFFEFILCIKLHPFLIERALKLLKAREMTDLLKNFVRKFSFSVS